MAQIRFHEYQSSLDSFPEALRFLGILEPGVYRGFDVSSFTNNQLTLAHSATGVSQTNIANDTVDHNVGVLYSKQGVVIQETDSVSGIICDFNTGNSSNRIDYVVCEHAVSEVQGGADATYSIIKGPVESTNEPTLTNPNTQVLVGKLIILAGEVDHSNTIFMRERTPSLGNTFFVPLKGTSEIVDYRSISHLNDLDKFTINGLYLTDSNPDNKPPTGGNGKYMVMVLRHNDEFTFQWVVESQLGKVYYRVYNGSEWTSFISSNNSDITVTLTTLQAELDALTLRVTANEDYISGDLATTLSNIQTNISNLDTALQALTTVVNGHTTQITDLETSVTDIETTLNAMYSTLAPKSYKSWSGTHNMRPTITSANGVVYEYTFPTPNIPPGDMAAVLGGTSRTLNGLVICRMAQEGGAADDLSIQVRVRDGSGGNWNVMTQLEVTLNDFGWGVVIPISYTYPGTPTNALEFSITLTNLGGTQYIHNPGVNTMLMISRY